MNKPIKTLAVLIIEDLESDAELLVRLLKKAGYELLCEQVETAEQMRAALEKRAWDIVISDYKMPQFDGLSALKILQEAGSDIPFIVVSGTIGEETAVAMLKAGAHDYLIKGDFARLVPAVERELEQAEIRRGHRQAEKALAASESELRALFASMQDVVLVIDREGVYRKIAPTNPGLLLKPASDLVGKNLRDVFPALRAETFIGAIRKVLDTKQTSQIEYELLIGDRTVWFETSISPMGIDSTLWVARDVSARKQAEEALAASEAKLRALVEQVPAVVYTESADTKETLYISPQVEKLTGYTSAQWIGDRYLWKTMVHPEDLPTLVAEDERTTATREPFQVEYRILTRDGRTLWLRDEAVIIKNQNGTPLFWQGVIHDITERRQAEEAMRTTNILLEQTIEQSPVPMVLVSMPDGIIRSVNSACRRFLGLEDDPSPVGELLAELKISWQDFDIQGNPAIIEDLPLPRSLRGLKTFQERHIIRKDGTSVYGLIYGSPIFDDVGRLIAGYLVMVDITERKQMEEALRESEEKFAKAFRDAPVWIAITDMEDGTYLDVNEQVLYESGFSRDEVIGYTATEIGWITVKDRVRMAKELRDHGRIAGLELTFHAKDGRLLYGWVNGDAIVIGGRPCLLTITVNITERKQVEATLQISQERYRKLFNSMTVGFILHEIIYDESGKPIDYRFLEVNPAYERLTGLQAESLIGRTVLEIMPDTDPYWIEVFGKVALTGRSILYENYSGELGSYFKVSVYCPQLGQFAVLMEDITERMQAEESMLQHVMELEMLHESGLALGQLLNPKEIGQKILELLKEKMGWHHTRIRLYHPQDDSLELLDFKQPGLQDEVERDDLVERFKTLITNSSQGMSGWVVHTGQSVRSGDVISDPRYVEAYPGIHSGLYVPMKLGDHIIGVISIEDERTNVFSAADERLVATLAHQAASAFENARLFEEKRQRVMELETLNRISLVLRTVSKQDEMLSIVLDEALAILNTLNGSIEIYNKATDNLDIIIARGWKAQLTTPPHKFNEGIAGRVFTTGEVYISREFTSDPETRDVARDQIPPNWGGVCLPIRTTQQTLGILLVSVPSERELSKDEIRLLATLSEMTGAALQRMQLHEQTVRRLEQLHALRAVDQAIASNLDMSLTLNILLDHTVSQLGVDAADVLLLPSGSSILELVASRGFHSHLLESTSFNNSFAKRAIMEHRLISALSVEIINQNVQFGKLWKEEGFACYWCVPLVVKGEVKGVLEIYRREEFTPDTEWLEFLESLAGQAAITIDTAQLFENLQRANLDLNLAYDATIEGWSRAMDLRDHETEGHTLRVTDLTMKLARAMRINESQLIAIRRGALLHDIGKMGVPDSILLKEGKLTDEEWALMRQHPQLAHDMLAPIAYLNDALNIPYFHHEKWDGTGYPQGLKGDQIPLTARIFAVIDVWDALTNDRPYRKKWTKQKARKYIKEQSGMHFDPLVVEVFLKQIG